jgi:drug/metabolite transporter (DMT)-like permease
MESDSNTFKASRNLPVGVIYTLLARCCAASFALVQKTILHKYRSRVVAAWTYLVGTAALLVGISPVAHEASDWQTTWQGALALAYAILLASALNFTIISYVNKVGHRSGGHHMALTVMNLVSCSD